MPRALAANELLVYLARHAAVGIVAGWICLGGILWFDIAGVSGLVARSDLWPLPLIMLLVVFATTFGGLATGAAVMAIGQDEQPPQAHR